MGAVETREGIVCARVFVIYLFIKSKGIFRGARKDDGKKIFAPFRLSQRCFSASLSF